MGGKGNYQKKEKQINSLISQYQVSCKTNQSHVIFCFDSDDYDKDPEAAQFLQDAKQYCSQHHYDFVWFCKDIERVYLGQKIDNKKKKEAAYLFANKKMVESIQPNSLSQAYYQPNTSNLLLILNKYLK